MAMHPLDGCKEKLTRAQESLDSLESDVRRYLSQDPSPFKFEKKHSNDGLEFVFVAYGDPNPPLRFAVIAGEIVHHMRSSLDHLIHALVTHRGEQPTTHHQFPICITPKAFKSACDRGQIKGVGVNAKRLIESVQPFKTATPDDTVLYVVSQYDNADKHRLLVVLTAVAHLGPNVTIGASKGVEEVSGKMPNIVGFGDMGVKKLTKEGVNVFSIKLAEPVPDFTADATPDFQLAFEQCGRVNCAPLISTLQNILEGVRNTIDSFENEFNVLTT